MKFRYRSKNGMTLGVALGIGLSIILVCSFLAGIAGLVGNEVIGEEAAQYIIAFIHIPVVIMGSGLSSVLTHDKKIIASIITIGLYAFTLLSVNILAFDGVFHGFLINFAGILVGLILVFFIQKRGARMGKRVQRRMRMR